MKSPRWLVVWTLALLALTMPLAAAAGPVVEIVSPSVGVPCFGEVLVEGRIADAQTVTELVIELDGRVVARLDAPPWQSVVDFGNENRAHHLRLSARDGEGRETVAEMEVPAVLINEEVELGLQQLYVTVTGAGGRRVLDLEVGDFVLVDEGREQEIVTFGHGDIPLTAVILVDASMSMEGSRLAAARAGAGAFLGGLEPLDEASLVVFADRVLAVSPFVEGGSETLPTLEQPAEAGGSAINDFLYFSLQLLESRQGRRVVILLSDGSDNHSAVTGEQIRSVAGRARSSIYWVRLRPEAGSNGEPRTVWRDRRDAVREESALVKAVRSTGGKIFTLDGLSEVEKAFRVILAELREEYALGYYPHDDGDDGRWREVRVEVRRRGLDVRTRDGYFDF